MSTNNCFTVSVVLTGREWHLNLKVSGIMHIIIQLILVRIRIKFSQIREIIVMLFQYLEMVFDKTSLSGKKVNNVKGSPTGPGCSKLD